MHSTLAVTTQGLPLGLLQQSIWARDEEFKQMSRHERRKVPSGDKESNKWLTALSETVKWQPEGTQVVTVGDSEADIFELFNHASHPFSHRSPIPTLDC